MKSEPVMVPTFFCACVENYFRDYDYGKVEKDKVGF